MCVFSFLSVRSYINIASGVQQTRQGGTRNICSRGKVVAIQRERLLCAFERPLNSTIDLNDPSGNRTRVARHRTAIGLINHHTTMSESHVFLLSFVSVFQPFFEPGLYFFYVGRGFRPYFESVFFSFSLSYVAFSLVSIESVPAGNGLKHLLIKLILKIYL